MFDEIDREFGNITSFSAMLNGTQSGVLILYTLLKLALRLDYDRHHLIIRH